jgi:tubulin polyglutamylase TTLL6/13
VHYTKYPIVRSVLRKDFKMRLFEEDFEDFDLLWCDHVLANDRIMRMKPYQRINHFPGMQSLYRKNSLGKNLNLMKSVHPEHYNFYPKTWLLPHEAKKLKSDWEYIIEHVDPDCVLIVKPEASC